MSYDREEHRKDTIRKLRFLGYFIALMGVVGLAFYYFDVAHARKSPAVIVVGTIFCIIASWRMFYLASVVRHWKD